MIDDKRNETEEEENIIFNELIDNNKIDVELKTIYFFKIVRVALITFSGSCFFALVSWIVFEVSRYEIPTDSDEAGNFITYYELQY